VYDSIESARGAKRALTRKLQASGTAAHCDVCDRYHISVQRVGGITMSADRVSLLLYVAQGYRDAEIAKFTGWKPRYVEYLIEQMFKRFYALNRAHLVAIVISLGIINPNEFVPKQEEAAHA
jgi:DNA-binding CsgD family transcriptional regulator